MVKVVVVVEVVVVVVVVVEVVVEVNIVVLEGRFPHLVLHGQHLPVRMLTHLFFLGWYLHSLQQQKRVERHKKKKFHRNPLKEKKRKFQ